MKTILLRVAQVLLAFLLGFIAWTLLLLVLLGAIAFGPLVLAAAALLVIVAFALVQSAWRHRGRA